ncbi:MAG: type II toxin-antitoxin system RelE/ParE family toxin [Rhodobacter sp.]|nr:type II toxin-antitoxin system RelE/ParE family toxin [Rhodobacter sp.]
MVYKVLITARAEADFQRLLFENADRYTPRERLDYVEAIRTKCRGLDWFPKRSTPVTIKGLMYWRLTFKAHTVFYRVFDDERVVEIEAVLHSAMDHTRRI